MRKETPQITLPVVERISDKGHKYYKKTARKFTRILLLPNRFKVHGLKNKIETGPNIIVANHTGAAKDIVSLYRIYDRMLFFIATHYLFDKNILDREIKKVYMNILVPNATLRWFANMVTFPIRRFFCSFTVPRFKEIGTIPVFHPKDVPLSVWAVKNRGLRNMIKAYLLNGRAVVMMQANPRQPSDHHPYVRRFKTGTAKIALDIYNEFDGLEIPITPVSIYGSAGLLTPAAPISMRVGEAVTVKPFLTAANPVVALTDALEKRVADMVTEDVEKYGGMKKKFLRRYLPKEK